MHQIQNVIQKITGYASKGISPAAVSYSTAEVGLFGLSVHIYQLTHLLPNVVFDCTVDHLALPYIIKSKNE